MGKNIFTARMISREIPSFSTINFPSEVSEILSHMAKKKNKITLFVGPTGSGKTTTMAACINDFSKSGGPFDNSVIISLEDPVEYIYKNTGSVNIIQKEYGKDFRTFSSGVRQALREKPTLVNIGETRDSETIRSLVEASRTGHGVYSSFHSDDVADAISRLYHYLISSNSDIMYDLISNMNMILCQKLVASEDSFNLKTQYVVFSGNIVKFLNSKIKDGENIPLIIESLFNDESLVKYGLVKDWS